MALSVEAAMQLEVFGRTSLHVFAGSENLDRTVRWVHPVEVPDIARFLTGGEMLLTAGLGIGRAPEQQRRYIREIAGAGAAVLVVELSGRAFSTMPPALVEEAERLRFPLIGLADELPFVEISAQVHEFLRDQRTAELAAFEQLNDSFIRLLLASREPISFTEALAHQLGCPVVLEDVGHDVLAYSGGTSATDALMRNWGMHARVLHRTEDPVAGAEPAQGSGCTRRPIVLRGERWGWLHVLHGTDSLNDVGSYALDRTADTIAITLLGDRESGARDSHRQSSLINRLLLGDVTGEQFVTRALKAGRDLRDRPLAVVFLCKESAGDTGAGRSLEAVLRPLHAPAVLADTGEHIMAVTGLSARLSEQELISRLGTRGLRAGVSRGCTPGGLPDAIQQARTAASVAAARTGAAVLSFDELGVLRLLVSLACGPELGHYVDDELGALLEHDANTANPLLPTLRAYLACDGNKTQTAEQLFVQRRTLYYRLDRLNTLLGKSLEDHDARQSLGLAVRALDFLRSQDDEHERSPATASTAR